MIFGHEIINHNEPPYMVQESKHRREIKEKITSPVLRRKDDLWP